MIHKSPRVKEVSDLVLEQSATHIATSHSCNPSHVDQLFGSSAEHHNILNTIFAWREEEAQSSVFQQEPRIFAQTRIIVLKFLKKLGNQLRSESAECLCTDPISGIHHLDLARSGTAKRQVLC